MAEPQYRGAPGVIETELDAELILLDPASGEMFSLNGTGARAWRAIKSAVAGLQRNAIVDALLTAYGGDPQRIDADVGAFLQRMVEVRLLIRADE